MKHDFDTWTVQQFVEKRREQRRRRAYYCVVLVALLAPPGAFICAAIFVAWGHHVRTEMRNEGTVGVFAEVGGNTLFAPARVFSVLYDQVCYEDEILDPTLRQAVTTATRDWEIALGVKIKAPKLLRNNCACPQSIACATNGGIVVTNLDQDRMDAYTIMAHEVGHILGVPHIVGDPLMDPTYGVDMGAATHRTAITPAAIALARLAQNIK